MKIKKSYSFAFRISIQLAIFMLFLGLVARAYYHLSVSLLEIMLTVLFLFIISFVLIQHYTEKFIYQRIQKIYQDVSTMGFNDIKKIPKTSDLETLSEEVSKFANEKLLEIESLNEQAKYRREFMGNVAHELKTPLFSIQGYLLTLMDGAISDKKVRDKYLKQAEKNVERLVNIVEDLDLISKMDSKKLILHKQEFDIVSLTKNVFDMMEIHAKKNKIKLVFDQSYFPIFVVADRQRIEQVLENLITNAIKYGKKDGMCMVRFEAINPKKIKVYIHDEGEGIPKEHLNRIFERFYRVDSGRSREEGGSGLGLSIVKHIIETHHQKIWVDSEKGKGSTFCFTLETKSS